MGQASGSHASLTVASNLGVLGQSPEEEFKFQFAPFQPKRESQITNQNKEIRLSYATAKSQESELDQLPEVCQFPIQRQ